MKFAGIEAGGTKFVCVIGDEYGQVFARTQVPTTTPDETMPKVVEFLTAHQQQNPLDAIGIACFGPIDPKLHSPTYGYITSTPKLPWRNYNIVGEIKNTFAVPIQFDTDVNGAALGEYYWGNGQKVDNFIYLTVGTGIGGGVISKGELLHGAMHPEMGHILIPQDGSKDPFPGVCPYHGNCLEGLASGPAIKARWLVDSALDLEQDHPAWDLEAEYLAAALMNYLLCFAPERIILGGGVMKQPHLLPLIQAKTKAKLAGYLENSTIEKIEQTIVLAALGQEAGNIGALALARLAIANVKERK